jgi:hypothetical protein
MLYLVIYLLGAWFAALHCAGLFAIQAPDYGNRRQRTAEFLAATTAAGVLSLGSWFTVGYAVGRIARSRR